MSKAEICAGVCGFNTTVIARKNGDGRIALDIRSDCKSVQKLAAELTSVDAFREFSWRRGSPETLETAPKCLAHPACPVPTGIIKAVEVEAGLALPRDISIKLSKESE